MDDKSDDTGTVRATLTAPSRGRYRDGLGDDCVMTDTDEPNKLAELRAALRERGGGRRSPLFQWMYRNHDALLEMLSEVRPNWPIGRPPGPEAGASGGLAAAEGGAGRKAKPTGPPVRWS